jgi:hypothetical protein
VNVRGNVPGVQRFDLTGTGCGAPNIDPANGFGTTENHRASGKRHRIGCVSDANAGDIGQPFHIPLVNNPLYASIDFVEGRNRESPAGLDSSK